MPPRWGSCSSSPAPSTSRVGNTNKHACSWSPIASRSDTRPGVEPYTVRVIYGDTDQMGVVYYANYLRFFEGARGHFIRNLGLSYGEIERRGILLPVLEASVHHQHVVVAGRLEVLHRRLEHRQQDPAALEASVQ